MCYMFRLMFECILKLGSNDGLCKLYPKTVFLKHFCTPTHFWRASLEPTEVEMGTGGRQGGMAGYGQACKVLSPFAKLSIS